MHAPTPPIPTDDLRLRVIPAIAEVDAAAWDACANPGCDAASTKISGSESTRSIRQNLRITHSFHTIFFMRSKPPARPRRGPAGSPSTCWPKTADGAVLGVVPCYLKSHSQRRIRLRPRLGRGLRARRRPVLPQAPGLGAVHAGDRPAAAGPPVARCRQGARRPDRRPARALPQARGLVGPLHLPAGGGMRRPWSGTASCIAPTSSSTGRTTATRPSTRSWRRCRRASARPSGASGATRSPPASRCTG